MRGSEVSLWQWLVPIAVSPLLPCLWGLLRSPQLFDFSFNETKGSESSAVYATVSGISLDMRDRRRRRKSLPAPSPS